MQGVIAAFAGLLLTMEINVFFPTQGQGMLLPVMAAVFIGGTSIAGGQPVLVGTFFGAYIIGSLEAGVVATGIGGYWVQLVEGLVMAGSVLLNVFLGDDGIPGLPGLPAGGPSPPANTAAANTETTRLGDGSARRWRAGCESRQERGPGAFRVMTRAAARLHGAGSMHFGLSRKGEKQCVTENG